MPVIKKNAVSFFSIFLLILGVILILYSVVDLGPKANEDSKIGWWAFGIGVVSIISSAITYTVDISFRSTKWFEVIISVLISVLFFVGYTAWLEPVKGDPVIFHPAIMIFIFALLWFAISLYCAFRVSKS